MKQLNEMSWEELLKLREQINADLGDDEDESDDDDLVKSYDSDTHEWIEGDLIDALAALHEVKEAAPSVKKGAPKSPPKGYPSDKGKYADPTNFKYPLDTEAHVRAALSYFSKSANRSKGGYSPEEQKFMWKRIIAAAKKYGINLSDDVKKHAEMLGLDSNSEGEGVKEGLNEKEIIELIDKHIHEQMQQNPGGTLAQGTKGHGGMESYNPQVRVPADIEAINTQLEGFRQQHAKHEAANKDMSDKVAALTKQVSDMQEAFKAMSTASDDDDDDDGDDGNGTEAKSTEAKAAKGAKGAKAADGAKAAATKKTGKDSEDSEDSNDGDSDSDDDDDDSDGDSQEEKAKNAENKEKAKKKVKEQAQQAHAEGLVATSDMAGGNGVNPPGFATEDQDQKPRSFGDVMSRAGRQRRRGIGAN